MKKYQEEELTKSKQKITHFIILGVIVLCAVFMAEIWLANRFSTYGEKMQDLSNQKAALDLENKVLQSQIAEKTSLFQIEEDASSLGFIKINNIEYLNSHSLAAAK